MSTCRAPGCVAEATRYGHHCNIHKARVRRHGDVRQTGVSSTDLKPYLRSVQARIKKNSDNPIWSQCEARWAAVVGHAGGIVAAYNQGRPGSRYEHQAAREVVSMSVNVEARKVVEVTLAMYSMLELDRRRFVSDGAFSTQLVRRVRRLNIANVSFSADSVGRERRVYRDLSPKVTTIISKWLGEALGAVGLTVARLELRDMQRADEERLAFHQALAQLT